MSHTIKMVTLFLITFWGIHFCCWGKQLKASCLFEVNLLVCSHLPRGRKSCPWCRCCLSEVRMVMLWVGMQQRRFLQTGLQQWLLQTFNPFHEEQWLVCGIFPQTHKRQTCAPMAICLSHFCDFLFSLNWTHSENDNYNKDNANFLSNEIKNSHRLDGFVDKSCY